ncbi:hypothetical protein [Polycladidibacter hongkongensis]|uniref:hypothetical protein n=1 Tax=Polycladidibacter hongkongensis TaxID=1647556 RepID=UPI00082B10BE|nr:hypothetical protein [Pseudovibrio hongkongensis]
MIAVSGFFHLPIADASVTNSENDEQVSVPLVGHMPPAEVQLIYKDEQRHSSVLRQAALQYGRPVSSSGSVIANSTPLAGEAHKESTETAGALSGIQRKLREQDRLYLNTRAGYTLPLGHSWQQGFSGLGRRLPSAQQNVAGQRAVQDVLADLQRKHLMMQQLYLRLPKEKSVGTYAGYGQAFLLLSTAVMQAIQSAVTDEDSCQ